MEAAASRWRSEMELDSTLMSLLMFMLGVGGAVWSGGIIVGRWRTSLDAVTTRLVEDGRAASKAHEAVLEQIERAEARCAQRDDLLRHEIERTSAEVLRAPARIDVHVGDIGAHMRRNGAAS